jgi:hypothetical protein
MGDSLIRVGSYFENYTNRTHFLATLFHGSGYSVILAKNVLGKILGVFSQTNLVTLVRGEAESFSKPIKARQPLM